MFLFSFTLTFGRWFVFDISVVLIISPYIPTVVCGSVPRICYPTGVIPFQALETTDTRGERNFDYS